MKYSSYRKYQNISLVQPETNKVFVFDDVFAAGEWFAAQGIAATPNAGRTGIYYVLENRMAHYKHYVVASVTAIIVR